MRSSPRPPCSHRQREVGGDPGEEAPVAEHRAGVHGRGQEAVAAQVLAPQQPQRARAPGLLLAQPDLRLRHVAPDPEDEERRQHADEEDGAPAEARAGRGPRRRRRSSRRWPSVDCMRPSALPRCSAGQVSAISAAPVVHSPPMPRPRMKRKMASWRIAGREAAGAAGDGVDEDRDHERARAADAVGEEAEEQPADRPRPGA